MRIFKISENAEIVCEAKNTRNGFKHEATLFINGVQIAEEKICYLNRTWERYIYESVISKILAKAGYKTDKIREIINKFS